MKKIVLVLITFVLCVGFACAMSSKENKGVNLAVMQGPTGFSSVMLPDYVNVNLLSSPDEAVAKLVNGEIDMAVLPPNIADLLSKKGVKVQILAIVGEGMLSVLGTNENSDELYVPGAGGTPDQMAKLLYPEYSRNYSVSAPAQVAQLLIAGKCSLAILPQPFVNMVLAGNGNVQVFGNTGERWASLTGFDNYPMSVLVVRDDYYSSDRKTVENVKKDYAKSIEMVLSSPHEAALKIEELGIMKANLAELSIKDCALVYKEGKDAQEEIESYLKIVSDLK